MDPLWKDAVQMFFWLVASIGGVVAAFRGLHQMRQNRDQRAEELRWQRARESKLLVDEMEKSSGANAAMRMLDWTGREYDIIEGETALYNLLRRV